MRKIDLFVEGIKNMKTVGTITATSKYAIRKMLKNIDFSQVSCIVELGAGDGCITRNILQKLPPNAKLIAFEINEKFCAVLEKIVAQDPRLILVKDSAENIEQYLEKYEVEKIDYVVSALPLALLPDNVLKNILAVVKNLLPQTGAFIQIQYSLLSYKMLKSFFNSIDIQFVARNIPPALIYQCKNI
ncbi:MAG: methyltransferase domain-containing protein [Chitinophagales bacterium]|nr:methyltransferase domain-containing protein [Bacteroidota bacterium]MCB9042168.1 methyltransferase domain-containing protein [Chitinophagales bacterium]